MSFRVKTESFEGPFDLLLYLVSRQKVDIGVVSIAEITDQYLEEIARMDILDLDVASDFLLVASTLLEIKAASLIPTPKDEFKQSNFASGNKKYCQNCGTVADLSDRFCTNCGAKFEVELKCPNCGASVGSDDSFCTNCGIKLH